tara:strand:+ start:923 stop:1510 length:588 start_codon:yes stop_codon:yes gene_type:complete
MANLFQKLEFEAFRAGITPRTKESIAWFRRKAGAMSSLTGKKVMNMEPIELQNRQVIGSMFMFFYDPKTKDKLPYYDTFPLSVIVSRAPGGFYGLNLHYLAPTLRAKFLDGLLDITNNKAFDETTKFQARYNILQKTSKLRFYKPCFKHYLSKNVRSRFAYVPPPEWEIATFLPLANFEKAGQRQVYKDSKNMVA